MCVGLPSGEPYPNELRVTDSLSFPEAVRQDNTSNMLAGTAYSTLRVLASK
jgi:hypothetical protein